MSTTVHPTFSPVLLAIRDEIPDVRTFRFASPEGFAFTPGQFLMFHFADDPKTWRAYSLCSSPHTAREHFEVTIGMVGAFSTRLGALTPGSVAGLVVRGPFGRWVYDGTAPHAVLVSGGTGLTPFRAMCLLRGEAASTRITLCCAAKTPQALLYKDEYAGWRKKGIVIKETITQPGADPRWSGQTGRWTAASIFAAAGDPAAVYYLCGPNRMVQELREGLQALGVPASDIKTEKWGDYSDLF